eukprot:gene28390-37324_t
MKKYPIIEIIIQQTYQYISKDMLKRRNSNAGLQNLMTTNCGSHNSASFLQFDAEHGAIKFKFFNDSERKKMMTFDQALRKFVESDYNFVSLINNALLSNGNGAIFLECAPFSSANIDKKQFEFVIIPAPVLDRNRIDIAPFFDKFVSSFNSTGKKVTVFQNLDHSSSLIVPCPVDQRGNLADPKTIRRDYDHLQYMTHLTSFIRGPANRSGEFRASSELHKTQIVSLWEALGREARRLSDISSRSKDEDKPYWISTDGRGVSWLHLRIDPSPKYYKFSEYTTHKRELLEKTSAGPQQRTGDADESRSVRGRTAALSSGAGLVVGDRLEANFQSNRYPGKITSNRPDDSYHSLSMSKMISPRRDEGRVVSEYKSNAHHHIHQQQHQQQHKLTPRALSQQFRKEGYNGTSQSQQQNQNLYSVDYNQPGPFSSTPTQIITKQPIDHSVRAPLQQVVSIGTGISHNNNAMINRFNCSRGDFLQQTRADDCGRFGKPRAKSAPRYF